MLVPKSLLGRLPVRTYPTGLDRAFRELWSGFPFAPDRLSVPVFPPVNVREDEAALHAEVELPGLSLENVEILVKGRELTLRGRREDGAPEGAVYHRRERGTGSFERVLRLPVDVDVDAVQARFHNGVLEIDLPKSRAARPRRIEIRTGN
jgi:HSP20 family protein